MPDLIWSRPKAGRVLHARRIDENAPGWKRDKGQRFALCGADPADWSTFTYGYTPKCKTCLVAVGPPPGGEGQ